MICLRSHFICGFCRNNLAFLRDLWAYALVNKYMESCKVQSFKKGDLVTMLSDWDGKGSVVVRDLVVHSCGRKQMVLVDSTGAKFQGAFFDPSGSMFRTRVVPRLSVADAEAAGLAFAAELIAYESDRLAKCAADTTASAGYHKHIAASIAAIHEARVIRQGEG